MRRIGLGQALAVAVAFLLGLGSVAADPGNGINVKTWQQMPKKIHLGQGKKPNLRNLQHAFDMMSWQTFVSLNWPTTPNGKIRKNIPIGKVDAPGYWQHWADVQSIFRPGGAKPIPWGKSGPVPKPCRGKAEGQDGAHVMQFRGKVPLDVLGLISEPFETGPLVGQSGHYVRFTIQLNKVMYDYIKNNQLYTKAGQQAFDKAGKTVNFPCPSSDEPQGAAMVKSAWKVMGPQDDASDFHTVKALVPIGTTGCRRQTMGLVGFHVAHKIKGSPQWIWSTFEHVRNAPAKGNVDPQTEYNFYDPSCSDCPVNKPPPRPWKAGSPGEPSQIVRVNPVTKPTRTLNKKWQQALKRNNPDSVWANYRLISTQWPTTAPVKVDQKKVCRIPAKTPQRKRDGEPAPPTLANTTLESYIQGTTPRASSCINCHLNATDTTGSFSDFTYSLNMANSAAGEDDGDTE